MRLMRLTRFLAGMSLVVLSAALPMLVRADDDSAADQEFFEKRIRPILAEHCFECHSAKTNPLKGGLRLDSRDGLLAGGDSGAAVVAGEPEKSRLIVGVGYESEELQMPPAGKLAVEKVADLQEWVRRGAYFPKSDGGVIAKRVINLDEGRKHWAFQPAQIAPLPPVPEVMNLSWSRQRIDPFILAAQSQHGLQPSPAASKEVLLRRLKFDLLGLPPTMEETREFAADTSPDAFERLADRYLASPHYGERWGRHWLDLARYCDVPESWREGQARAWLYRDWVVQAVNGDLPYDDFVRKQLAADLLPGFEPRESAALGFLGLSPTYWKELKLDHNVIKQVVAEEWEERIDAIGGTFLGLTVACARCHDHKFDPVTSQDYYALAGVLASIRLEDRPIIAADLATVAQKGHDRVKELEGEIKKLKDQKPPPEGLSEKVKAFEEQIAEVKRTTPHFETPLAYSVIEASLHVLPDGPSRTKIEYKPDQPQDVCVQIRGSAANAGAAVPRRFLAVLTKDASGVFKQGSGRRELAEAIVTDSAPLAARVFVNRVWKQHFGRGLVNTPSNFGIQGEKPSHPELLDDLAARFIEHGWSLKWLHRQMVLSSTYQQDSNRDEVATKDPENIYLSRMPVRRLDVEAWRDAMLSATGELDEAMGGVAQELSELGNRRRTLYGTVKRRELSDLLRLHDFPDPVVSSSARVPTTSPLQQLFVLNSPYIRKRSEALVERLQAEVGSDSSARIRLAYQTLLQREPAAEELALAIEFVSSNTADGVSAEALWREYAQVLLASNELLFVD
ncbi:MAG: PSD1 and planctomycete cytochrome C domain-containing protein [Pirellulaceae bacterium]